MNSDVDILVKFISRYFWGLEFIQMREELAAILQRSVDLLTYQSLMSSYNTLRRQAILDSTQVIYAMR